MSKLDELIKKLCPNGVEYFSISDVANVGTGNSNGNEAVEAGKYPFFIRSQTVKRKNSYEYDEEAIIIPGEGGIGDIYHYINGKYALHQRAYRIHFIKNNINTKYAYYYFKYKFKTFILTKSVSSTVTSIRKPMIESFKIPVPPLEVQKEIVNILDRFTTLQTNLENELTARKKQYGYYRDTLLNFENGLKGTHLEEKVKKLCPNGVEYKELKDCCTILDKYRKPISKNLRIKGDYPYYGANGIQDYVIDYIFDGSFVLVGEDGSVMTLKGTPVVNWAEGKIWVNNHAHIIKENNEVILRYLYYYLQIIDISNLIHGNIPKLTGTDFKNIKIPVPPIEIQKEIVDILDKFESLCNSLTDGLPAEIEKRKKQYEYYRDKLLTFNELNEC